MRHVLVPIFALILATVLVPVASADGGDCPHPHHGPFDPCLWNCTGWERQCELVITTGHAAWHLYCDIASGGC